MLAPFVLWCSPWVLFVLDCGPTCGVTVIINQQDSFMSFTAMTMVVQDQRELDIMIQRYQDEQWAKYDAKEQALADARAALAAEVAQLLARCFFISVYLFLIL
jgi:hypothetical protein